MTLKASHARDLVTLAEQMGKIITVGYTFHFYDQSIRAHEVIASGELGAVEYLNCSFASDMTGFLSGNISQENSPTRFKVHPPSENYNKPEMLGGGQGHLQMTHPIGFLLFVTGLRARRVQAMMNNLGRMVDMVDTINVEFEGGALGVIGGTGNARHDHRMALAVYCQEGMYLLDTLAQYAAIRRYEGEQENLGWSSGSRPRYAVTHNFIHSILGSENNHAPGEVGWRAVEILDAAYQSVQENGRPIFIEELYS
jgi:predicted dehydrogenase